MTGRALVSFLFLAVPIVVLAGHEDGTSISITPEATEVAPGTRVTLRVRVREASGRAVPRADAVRVQVTRTLQALEGPSVHRQPKFRDLPPARLTVLATTPEESIVAVDVPHAPDVLVTIGATLDVGTPHEARTTTDVVGTLPVSGPSATPPPSPVPTRAKLITRLTTLPLPVVEKKTGHAIAVASTVVATGTTAAGMLSLVPDLGFILRHAGVFLLEIFSTRRRRAGWGMIVESSIGRPIARAIVLLLDTTAQKVRVSVVTSVNGVFAFAPPPGTYQLQARAVGYRFPAERTPPSPADPRAVVYRGEPVPVTERTLQSPPQLIVPLDRSVDASRVARASTRVIRAIQRVALRVSPVFFLAGFSWNTLVLLWYPSRLFWILEGIYVILFFLHVRVVFRRRRNYGRVLEVETRSAIPLASVRAYDNSSNRLTQTVVSDSSGRFFLFLPTGVYTVIAEKDGFSPAEDTMVIGRKTGAGVLGGDLLLPRLPGSTMPARTTALL